MYVNVGTDGAADIMSELQAIDKRSFSSELDRVNALAEAQRLVSRLQTPWETALDNVWIHPTRMACLKIATDLDLFKKWRAAGEGPKTEDELLKLVSCDPVLLRRVLSNLSGTRMLEETKPRVYSLSPFTSALAEPPLSGIPDMFNSINGPVMMNLPKYIASINYQNPNDASGNWGHMTGKAFWDWLKTNPDKEAPLGMAMGAYAANRPPLSDIYPSSELIKVASGDQTVLVDCGGSVGHDSASFLRAHPNSAGRVVLQDRPAVLDTITTLDTGIKRMPYDFFTPQLVEGAAAYYFHFILHDWPDSDCKKILDNVKPAMKRGHSKLLIHEIVMDANERAGVKSCCDITMMAMSSAHERTADEWTTILSGSGFKINRIYSSPLAFESVIEAELV